MATSVSWIRCYLGSKRSSTYLFGTSPHQALRQDLLSTPFRNGAGNVSLHEKLLRATMASGRVTFLFTTLCMMEVQ